MKPTLAWAVKSPDDYYVCICWDKKEATDLALKGEKVVRVEIREVKK